MWCVMESRDSHVPAYEPFDDVKLIAHITLELFIRAFSIKFHFAMLILNDTQSNVGHL